MIYDERYFTIWAPRQTGKSTYFRFLAEVLQQEGYKVCHVNFESFKEVKETDFLIQLGIDLFKQWGLSFDVRSIVSLFGQIQQVENGKMVLIIEGIDEINTAYLWTFLSSIRSAFHSRQDHALKSVILSGVSNIIRNAPNDRIPFNIGDDFILPYLSNEETRTLLEQHENETGQLFEDKVKTEISKVTANHPSLVNGLARKLIKTFPNNPILNYDNYLQVESLYLSENMGNIGLNILTKAQKYRPFIKRLLSGNAKESFSIHHKHCKDLWEEGLISYNESHYIIFKVPLYQKYLHNI